MLAESKVLLCRGSDLWTSTLLKISHWQNGLSNEGKFPNECIKP